MRSRSERLLALACVLLDRSCPVGAVDRDSIDLCGVVVRAVAGDSTDVSGRAGLVAVPLSSRDPSDVENRCDPELAGVLSGTVGGFCAAGGVVVLDALGAPRDWGEDWLGVELVEYRRLVMRSMTDLRVLSLLGDGADDDGGVARLRVLGASILVPNLLVAGELDGPG